MQANRTRIKPENKVGNKAKNIEKLKRIINPKDFPRPVPKMPITLLKIFTLSGRKAHATPFERQLNQGTGIRNKQERTDRNALHRKGIDC
jgi:hypothetical protein